jgi:hypothetical protein
MSALDPPVDVKEIVKFKMEVLVSTLAATITKVNKARRL